LPHRLLSGAAGDLAGVMGGGRRSAPACPGPRRLAARRRSAAAWERCRPGDRAGGRGDGRLLRVLRGRADPDRGRLERGGAPLALLVSSSIRTYARMHVFIAFLAFFCVALLLDRLYRSRRRAGVLVAAAVAVVGLSDQVTAHMVPQYAQRAREYRADAAFI